MQCRSHPHRASRDRYRCRCSTGYARGSAAARARARYAGLLTVQGGAALGRLALAEPGIDTAAINNVLIPLDASSAFRTVTQSQQPHVGPLVSGDPSIDTMVLRMGGAMPPSGE